MMRQSQSLELRQQPAMRQVQVQRPELPRPPPPFKMPEEFKIKASDNGTRRAEKKKLQAYVEVLKGPNPYLAKKEVIDTFSAIAMTSPRSELMLPCMQMIYDAARSIKSERNVVEFAMEQLSAVVCAESVRNSAKGRDAFPFFEAAMMRLRRGRAGDAQQIADRVVHDLVKSDWDRNKEAMFPRLSPELIGTTKALDWKRGETTTKEDSYCDLLRDWSAANNKHPDGSEHAARRAVDMLQVLEARKEICLAQRGADIAAIETHFGHYAKAVCDRMSSDIAKWVNAVSGPEAS